MRARADAAAEAGNVELAKKIKKRVAKKVKKVDDQLKIADAITQKSEAKAADKKADELEKKAKDAKDGKDKKAAEKFAKQAENAREKADAEKKEAEKAIRKADAVKSQSKNNEKKKGNDKKKDDKKKKKHAFGGLVGGYGNSDSVNAMLTPGEFVMTKGAAARYGKALERINSPSFRFADKAGMIGGRHEGPEGNVYNVTINANGVADAEEIATITLKKIKELDTMRVREMRKF